MKRVFDVARELNNRLKIVVRLRDHSSIALFPADAQTVVVDEELVVSVALASSVVAASKGRVPDGTEDEDEAGEAALAARRLFEDEYRRAVARIREGSPTEKPVVPNTPKPKPHWRASGPMRRRGRPGGGAGRRRCAVSGDRRFGNRIPEGRRARGGSGGRRGHRTP